MEKERFLLSDTLEIEVGSSDTQERLGQLQSRAAPRLMEIYFIILGIPSKRPWNTACGASAVLHALRLMLILQLCHELFSHVDPAMPKSGSIPHLEVALRAFTAQQRRLCARMEGSGLFSLTNPFTWCQFC